jgi:hypothetical protein
MVPAGDVAFALIGVKSCSKTTRCSTRIGPAAKRPLLTQLPPSCASVVVSDPKLLPCTMIA